MNEWTIIKIYNNHIKDYGFISDLLNKTIYGLTESEYGKYNRFKTEFEADVNLEPYKVYDLKIPRGKLIVYGQYVTEYEI